jgi:hypothetical protein
VLLEGSHTPTAPLLTHVACCRNAQGMLARAAPKTASRLTYKPLLLPQMATLALMVSTCCNGCVLHLHLICLALYAQLLQRH